MTLTLNIAGISDETDRIRVFELTPAGAEALPAWTPGAHLCFDLGPAGSRSYSLIAWPGQQDGRYRIAVQREDEGSGGSKAMHGLKPGDRLTATPPKNDFELGDHAGPALLLAGGIGITPMIAMATALSAEGRDFRLVYAARSRAVMGFGAALGSAFGDRVTLAFDDETPLDLDALMAGLDARTHLYVCGPRGMIEAARAAAARAGLPGDQVHVEL
ncbi:MAG: oxidoreductase, partial [Rhodobacteraceae bacterium]